MSRLRALTRPLLMTWPVLIALIAIALVSHDVAMAAHPHDTPIPAGVVEINLAHPFGEMHDGLLYETDLAIHPPLTNSPCPTDFCPELTDCGLVRVNNPDPRSGSPPPRGPGGQSEHPLPAGATGQEIPVVL